jgi:chromosome segregation ATPase
MKDQTLTMMMLEDLRKKTSSLEQKTKNQQAALANSEKKLKESLIQEDALRQKLFNERNSFDQRSKELQGARTDTGKIAIFAEELREKNLSLERYLAQQKENLNRVQKDMDNMSARENCLKSEITVLKSESEQRIQELEASLEEGRQQLEGLSKTQGDAVTNLKETLIREEALKEEISKQNATSERRLKELRQILGVEEASVSSTHSPTKSQFVPFSLNIRFA